MRAMKHFLIVLFLLIVPLSAAASKVALVIGNAEYSAVARLDNPHNDARDVAQALARQGFDVIAATDLTRNEMRDALRDFRQRADAAEMALVYYAGHGIEVGGRNYLIPVDARLEDARDAELEMVDLDLVLGQISGAGKLRMVVLDACRNNPFVTRMQSATGGRSVSSGLGRVETAQSDTLIAYAAAAGGITPDGVAGENSPFTTAFLAAMQEPPTDVRRLLGRVRDKMRKSVPDAAPFVYASLGGGEFVINPNSDRAPVQAAPAAPGISEDFVRIDRDGTFEDWNDFLVRHQDQADHPLYAFALEKREALREADAYFTPATDPDEGSEVAARPEQEGESRTLVIVPVQSILSRDEAARRLQRLLGDVGCYRGAIDGIIGRGSKAAIDRFIEQSGVDVPRDPGVSEDALKEALARVEENPDVDCPAPVVVRHTPPRTTPKPPKPEPLVQDPAPRTSPRQPALPDGSIEPRRTKLLPEAGTNLAECRGNRAKFYQCP